MRARRVLVCCFVALLVALTVSHSAAAPELPLSEHNLDALDTSFSRMLAIAMQSSKQASYYKVTAASAGAAKPARYEEDDEADDKFPFDIYGPDPSAPKPTLGEWFKNLLDEMQQQIDAQDVAFVGPKYIHPKKGSSDNSYDGPHGGHDSHHHDHDSYCPHDSYGQHEQYGPDHDQRYKSHEQYRYEPQHKTSFRYQGKSDDACVQETARSSCETQDISAIKYTSSLSCCSTPYGNQHYGQQPSGDPQHPKPYSYTVNKATTSSSSSSSAAKTAAAAPAEIFNNGKPTKTAGLPAKLAYYDTPKVFYPRGGNSECLWSIAYHDSVEVVSGTEQIGVATATCHFNRTMDHCASPLCDGLTLTISADVYTTYAVSRYGPVPGASDAVAPSLDDTCNNPEWDFGFNRTRQTAPRTSSPFKAAAAPLKQMPKPVQAATPPPMQTRTVYVPVPTPVYVPVPTPAQAAQPDEKTPTAAAAKPQPDTKQPAPAAEQKPQTPAASAAPAAAAATQPKPAATPAPAAAADPKPQTSTPAAAAKPAPAATADPAPKVLTPAAAAKPAPAAVADPKPQTSTPPPAAKPAPAATADPKFAAAADAKSQTSTPAAAAPAPAGAPATATPKPTETPKAGAAPALTAKPAVLSRTARHMDYRGAKAATQKKHVKLHPANKKADNAKVGMARLQYYDGPMYGDRDYFMFADTIVKNAQDSGLFGGKATIITGVITSITGLEKGMEYHRGMVEHVVRFEGAKLTAAEYEALPYDTPHISPGKYKIVFMEDEHRY